jgi:CDP-glucose 4,6-dehydratase
MRSVIRGERPIIRSDGTFRRDYLFVDDAVSGYMDVAQQLDRAEIQGQAFNFGMDQPTTALEIVQTILSLSGCPDLDPIILDQAHNEIPDQFLASEKAHRLLGWRPGNSLREGLNKTFLWYRHFLTGE